MLERIPNNEVNPALRHLTPGQVNELCQRYRDGDKVKSLLEEFKISDVSPGQLWRLLPPIVHEDTLCPYCSVAMHEPVRKGGYQYGLCCPHCGHLTSEYCRCSNCVTRQRQQELRRIQEEEAAMIQQIEKLGQKAFEGTLDDLNIRTRLYIAALIRSGLDEDLELILPVKHYERPLTPANATTYAILQHLVDHRIIAISQKTTSDAIKEWQDGIPVFALTEAAFSISVKVNDDKFRLVDYLMNPSRATVADAQEIYELWIELAKEEIKAYLIHRLNSYGLSFRPGTKTNVTIEDGLRSFSTAQMFNFVWRSARNAAAYMQEHGISKPRAANSAITSFRNELDKARANEWEIKPFIRPYEYMQSSLSQVFYDRVLGVGNAGFHTQPSLDQTRTWLNSPGQDDES